MSELSEHVSEIFKKAQDAGDGVTMEKNPVLTVTPGFEAARNFYGAQTLVYMRRAYRENSGRAAFTSPEDALERTSFLQEELVPLVCQAMADGAQIGQGVSNAVKKHKLYDTLDEIFESESFRFESVTIASTFLSDGDLTTYISDYIGNGAAFFSVGSGYTQMSDDILLNKIWDVWCFAVHSACIIALSAGHELGVGWQTTDALEGITRATEAVEEEEPSHGDS